MVSAKADPSSHAHNSSILYLGLIIALPSTKNNREAQKRGMLCRGSKTSTRSGNISDRRPLDHRFPPVRRMSENRPQAKTCGPLRNYYILLLSRSPLQYPFPPRQRVQVFARRCLQSLHKTLCPRDRYEQPFLSGCLSVSQRPIH